MSRRRLRQQRAGQIADQMLEEVRLWPRDRLLALASDASRTRVHKTEGDTYDVVVQGYPESQPDGFMHVIVSVNDVDSLAGAVLPQTRQDVLPIPD
jgi:hypothetical protein